MNRKKMMALLTAAAFVIGMMVFPVSAANDSGNLYIDAVWALGIMESDNTDSFLPEETVERIDAIKYILNFMNIKQYSGDGQRHFTDVSIYSDYYTLTTTAMQTGIIIGNPDGEFRPNDETSMDEALVMMLRAMGYDKLANAKGGSMAAYWDVARQYGFLKGISTSGAYITRGDMARLFYNAFDIGMMEYTTIGTQNTIGVNDNRKGLSRLGLKMGEGTLTANPISSVYYTAKRAASGYVEINDKEYRIGDSGADRYLGYHVEFYYAWDEDDENTGEIVLIYPKRNETLICSLEEGSFLVEGSALYYTSDNNGKKNRIDISPESIIIKNGVSVPYDLSFFENAPAEGSVTFVKTGNNSFYNVVEIYAVLNDVVRGLDTEAGKLELKFGGTVNLPEKHLGGTIFVTKNGEPAELGDVKSGDVISYSIDENSRSMTMALCDTQISGAISEIDFEGGRLRVTIGGNRYLIDDVYFGADAKNLTQEVYERYNVKLGNNVVGFVSGSGSIVDLEMKSARNYGFVLEAGVNSSLSEKVEVKLFTTAGDAVIYELSDKLKIDGSSTKNLTSSELCARLGGQTEIIAYELDSSGKISELLFPQEPSGNLYADQGRFVRVHTVTTLAICSGITLDGIGMQDTQLFTIPNAAAGTAIDEDDCECGKLERQTNYKDVVFYDVGLNGMAAVALRRAAANSGYQNIPVKCYVVRNVTPAVQPDGESGYKLNYISGGAEGSVFLADTTTNLSTNANSSIKAQELQFGDIIVFEADKHGKMKKFSVLYREENQKDETGIINLTGDGVGNNRACLVLKGTAQYISGDNLTVKYLSSGGRANYELFTGMNAQSVTVVNRKEKKFETREISSILPTTFSLTGETPGDTIIVNANRNALNEVIVYED